MSSESTLAVTVAWICGCPLTVTHTAGTVAPVTRTVTYGTVSTTLTGAPECWITQNLGAINQASSPTDATDAAAGWYWEWDTQQGYDYNTSLTPSTLANTYGTDDVGLLQMTPVICCLAQAGVYLHIRNGIMRIQMAVVILSYNTTVHVGRC